jgi:hypothetical protein
VAFDAGKISALDTSGAWLLERTVRRLCAQALGVTLSVLRPALDALVNLVAARAAMPAASQAARQGEKPGNGRWAWIDAPSSIYYVAFVGESFTTLLRSPEEARHQEHESSRHARIRAHESRNRWG